MTAAELIEILQRLDPAQEVQIASKGDYALGTPAVYREKGTNEVIITRNDGDIENITVTSAIELV